MSAKSRLGGANRAVAPALTRLNGVMSQRFAGLATSPVPVLVPFDVGALLRDQAAGADPGDPERYFSGFHAANGLLAIQVAKPSFSQMSSHHFIVTRSPNH